MKKLVLVVAMFVVVCSSAFVANAQDPVKNQQQTETKDTITTEEQQAVEVKVTEEKSENGTTEQTTEETQQETVNTQDSTQVAE